MQRWLPIVLLLTWTIWPTRTELGRVLVTGGSGFVGANLVSELLERGHEVRSFDRAPSPLPAHPRLQVVQGDICDKNAVVAAVEGVDTVFHTAAIIDLMGGASVTDEYRQRSFAVNVGGTENLVEAAQAAGVKRFVYTASNSVVMGGQRISGGDETLPYTERFNDLYTETKVARGAIRVVAERCSRHADLLDPAQRHLGPRRSDHVPQAVRERPGRTRQGARRRQARQAGQLVRAQPDSRVHPGRPTSGARRDGAGAGVLHQRRRADQHVRVLPAGRRGVRAALAEVPDLGRVRALGDDGVAVAALPFRAAQAAVRAARGRAALPRQLLLHRQGGARSGLSAAVHHRRGHARMPAVLHGSLRADEGAVARGAPPSRPSRQRIQRAELPAALSWSGGPGGASPPRSARPRDAAGRCPTRSAREPRRSPRRSSAG